MADQQWFYAQGSETTPQGPLPVQTLREWIASGRLPLDTRVWTEGMAGWETAAMRPELGAVGAGSASANFTTPTAYAPNAYQPPDYQAPAHQTPAHQTLGYQTPGYQTPGVSTPIYAGFWMRFAAYVIDYVITLIASFIIGFIVAFFAALALHPTNSSGRALITTVVQLISVILAWLYFALMESSPTQGTVGKMAVGIVVTDAAGNRIGFGQATGRFFGKIVSGLILCIGFMMAGWTAKKQALHDIMAGTLVIRKPGHA